MKYERAINVKVQLILLDHQKHSTLMTPPSRTSEVMTCASSCRSTGVKRQIGGISLSRVNFHSPFAGDVFALIGESALLRSREVVEKALNSPIAAIDTRDDMLEAIRDTRLSDPESWRTVIQNAPLTERKYLTQLHELLSDLATESRAKTDGTESYSNAFIYNYRTGSCLYYDLGGSVDR